MMSMGKVFRDLIARAETCEDWFKPGKLIAPGGEVVKLSPGQ